MLSCKKKYKTLLMELKNENISQMEFLGMINISFLILKKWKFCEMVLMLLRWIMCQKVPWKNNKIKGVQNHTKSSMMQPQFTLHHQNIRRNNNSKTNFILKKRNDEQSNKSNCKFSSKYNFIIKYGCTYICTNTKNLIIHSYIQYHFSFSQLKC
jgi:hypothetical protein